MKKTILLPALLVVLSGCHGTGPVPEGVRYVSRAEWGAAAPLRPMQTHRIDRITIHHTGSPQARGRTIEDKLRGLQRFSQAEAALEGGRRRAAWADIPYHLYVGTDGSVGEGREIRFTGESNTPYDPTGHLLVVVEGNFENEPLTEAQRRTLDRLIPGAGAALPRPRQPHRRAQGLRGDALPGEGALRGPAPPPLARRFRPLMPECPSPTSRL